MITKRIVPCLDVKDWKVVKGVKFKNHKIIWDVLELAEKYANSWADELVFYDISASTTWKTVDKKWVWDIAKVLNIPFCVAGWIRTVEDAKKILNLWADKISINSPALDNPDFINKLVEIVGSQAVVIWIDSYFDWKDYFVYKYTWSEKTIQNTKLKTADWIKEVVKRWAWEIVLNCINQDWVRKGYDLEQLKIMWKICKVPLIASGGAGEEKDFLDVFEKTSVSWALAASVFHYDKIEINNLKKYLKNSKINIRI